MDCLTMRFPAVLLACTALSLPAGALAQAPAPSPAQAPPSSATAAPQPAEANPVLARVDGAELRLNDVMATAAEALPPEMREVPPATLRAMLPPQVFSQLVDRAITDRVMVNAARAAGLERDEELRRRLRTFEEGELRDTLLRREVLPKVTDEALRARWQRDVASRPAEEEVRARHILVPNEADARAILAEVQRGGNFEEIARRRSSDPAARNGGDLGFFRRGDMVPEFATAAFALQPGQVSPQPVRSQFGWHVIKLEERRSGTGPFLRRKQGSAPPDADRGGGAGRHRPRARRGPHRAGGSAGPAAPAGIQADPPRPASGPAPLEPWPPPSPPWPCPCRRCRRWRASRSPPSPPASATRRVRT
jgi:peptidyl-prolyl cis-trans isomerase C